MIRKLLTPAFFARDARVVAKELLGKYLVRKMGGKAIAHKIVETEAYLGTHDLASHARSGITKRNAPMFGPPGHWYVYFTYGMHYMLNIVTGTDGEPSAVLIRGVETITGPGRLTKQLLIDKMLNTKKAVPASGLWIEDRPYSAKATKGKRKEKIIRTARIGVDYAGDWAKKPYRFMIAVRASK